MTWSEASAGRRVRACDSPPPIDQPAVKAVASSKETLPRGEGGGADDAGGKSGDDGGGGGAAYGTSSSRTLASAPGSQVRSAMTRATP